VDVVCFELKPKSSVIEHVPSRVIYEIERREIEDDYLLEIKSRFMKHDYSKFEIL
jgi:hypothetical protein